MTISCTPFQKGIYEPEDSRWFFSCPGDSVCRNVSDVLMGKGGGRPKAPVQSLELLAPSSAPCLPHIAHVPH